MKKRNKLRNKTVLVTGGAGFIGSHLVDKLIELGASEVVIIDNLFVGNKGNLKKALESKKVTFYVDDAELMTSLDYIFDKHKISIVFNCATKALNYSFVNPSNAFLTNVSLVLNLLELLRKKRFSTLCHFSTSEVYGSAIYEPMSENHPKNPTTTYASGKAAADLAVETYVKMFNIDAFIVRPFNNFGPRQNFDGFLAGVIPITIMKILKGLKPEIHGNGEQSRDFIFVKDTVDAVIKLYDVLPPGESVNISSSNQIKINNLIEIICKTLNYQGKIIKKPSRYSDVLCHIGSNKKIKTLIDYRLTDFEYGLEKTLNYYISINKS